MFLARQKLNSWMCMGLIKQQQQQHTSANAPKSQCNDPAFAKRRYSNRGPPRCISAAALSAAAAAAVLLLLLPLLLTYGYHFGPRVTSQQLLHNLVPCSQQQQHTHTPGQQHRPVGLVVFRYQAIISAAANPGRLRFDERRDTEGKAAGRAHHPPTVEVMSTMVATHAKPQVFVPFAFPVLPQATA
jgi:hypothetical protein